jgi:hypothetical protein
MPAAQDSKTSVRIWRFADLNRGFGDVRSQRAEQTITLGPPTSKFDPWRTRGDLSRHLGRNPLSS